MVPNTSYPRNPFNPCDPRNTQLSQLHNLQSSQSSHSVTLATSQSPIFTIHTVRNSRRLHNSQFHNARNSHNPHNPRNTQLSQLLPASPFLARGSFCRLTTTPELLQYINLLGQIAGNGCELLQNGNILSANEDSRGNSPQKSVVLQQLCDDVRGWRKLVRICNHCACRLY